MDKQGTALFRSVEIHTADERVRHPLRKSFTLHAIRHDAFPVGRCPRRRRAHVQPPQPGVQAPPGTGGGESHLRETQPTAVRRTLRTVRGADDACTDLLVAHHPLHRRGRRAVCRCVRKQQAGQGAAAPAGPVWRNLRMDEAAFRGQAAPRRSGTEVQHPGMDVQHAHLRCGTDRHPPPVRGRTKQPDAPHRALSHQEHQRGDGHPLPHHLHQFPQRRILAGVPGRICRQDSRRMGISLHRQRAHPAAQREKETGEGRHPPIPRPVRH